VNTPLEQCRVVLVRASQPGNLGAVARAMLNFGLRRLCLVQPAADPLAPEALALATHAEPILRAAESYEDIAQAVSDCGVVIGTSARAAGLIRGHTARPVADFMPELAALLPGTPAALVFGPERTGLTNDEVMRCHHLVTIPAAPAQPVLNLAQAAVVCFYELYQACACRHAATPAPPVIADHASQELAYRRLEEALRDIHFLWNEKAAAQMHALRALLARARPTPTEIDLLHGVARQIRWYVAKRGQRRPGAAEAETAG
jgi:TrmH family RNA methyltransferase